MRYPQAATLERNPRYRKSSDSAWPLRRADGLTFAEASITRERHPELYQKEKGRG